MCVCVRACVRACMRACVCVCARARCALLLLHSVLVTLGEGGGGIDIGTLYCHALSL